MKVTPSQSERETSAVGRRTSALSPHRRAPGRAGPFPAGRRRRQEPRPPRPLRLAESAKAPGWSGAQDGPSGSVNATEAQPAAPGASPGVAGEAGRAEGFVPGRSSLGGRLRLTGCPAGRSRGRPPEQAEGARCFPPGRRPRPRPPSRSCCSPPAPLSWPEAGEVTRKPKRHACAEMTPWPTGEDSQPIESSPAARFRAQFQSSGGPPVGRTNVARTDRRLAPSASDAAAPSPTRGKRNRPGPRFPRPLALAEQLGLVSWRGGFDGLEGSLPPSRRTRGALMAAGGEDEVAEQRESGWPQRRPAGGRGKRDGAVPAATPAPVSSPEDASPPAG